jgi:UDP-3-O-[3-hydroxymyristoyl] glucosamine N-acyltransferase
MNLSQALDAVTGPFGVVEIRNPAALDLVRQTGFVWTRQPGVVCLAMTRRYFARARDNACVAAIIAPPAIAAREDAGDKALIVSARADELFHHLHFTQGSDTTPPVDHFEIDASARVDASAILRGHVRILEGATIGPRVVVSGPATIGRNARIEAGAVIGCEGLYAKTILGVRRHMPHLGGVDVGDGAHVLSGAVVVRSAIRGEDTRIGAAAHVGILSNIGHDAQVGEAATISSNVVVAGRAIIGAHAWVGASATISNMVSIGERAEVRLGSVVVQDVPAGGDVSGNFALGHARNMKQFLKAARDEP